MTNFFQYLNKEGVTTFGEEFTSSPLEVRRSANPFRAIVAIVSSIPSPALYNE
jgi:hypothetical protein